MFPINSLKKRKRRFKCILVQYAPLFFFFNLVLPVPDLLEEATHVDLLALHFHYPRMFEHPPWGSSPSRSLLQTAFDKILHAVTPLDLIVWLILQLRYRLSNNVCQQINQTCLWLRIGPVRGEWEPVLGDFE